MMIPNEVANGSNERMLAKRNSKIIPQERTHRPISMVGILQMQHTMEHDVLQLGMRTTIYNGNDWGWGTKLHHAMNHACLLRAVTITTYNGM